MLRQLWGLQQTPHLELCYSSVRGSKNNSLAVQNLALRTPRWPDPHVLRLSVMVSTV